MEDDRRNRCERIGVCKFNPVWRVSRKRSENDTVNSVVDVQVIQTIGAVKCAGSGGVELQDDAASLDRCRGAAS